MAEKKTTNGISYWVEPSKKDSKTLLFIHGFTGSHEGFQYIIPKLSGYTCIAPDLPGFGESDLWAGEWTIPELARRTNAFVRGLKLPEKPVLLGHSMGGLVVAAMLEDDHALYANDVILISPVVEKITLFDSRKIGAVLGSLQYALGHYVPKIGPKVVKSKTVTRFATNLITTAEDKAMRQTIHGHHYKNLEYISSYAFYHELHTDINRRGALDYREALASHKVLLIAASKDSITPLRQQEKLAQQIHAKLVVIPEVGHLTHYETPTAIAEAVNDFLQ